MNSKQTMPGPVRIDVDVACPGWRRLLPAAAAVARRAAGVALDSARLPADLAGRALELSVILTDDATIRRLNRDYRQSDRPTNVLSFAQRDGATWPAAESEPVLLGDVVVARQTVSAEATAGGRRFGDHLSRVVVHGVLHLLGYDHETDADAAAMEGVEAAALLRLGLDRSDQGEPPAAGGRRRAGYGG